MTPALPQNASSAWMKSRHLDPLPENLLQKVDGLLPPRLTACVIDDQETS
jgi:hypothetical protein